MAGSDRLPLMSTKPSVARARGSAATAIDAASQVVVALDGAAVIVAREMLRVAGHAQDGQDARDGHRMIDFCLTMHIG